MQKMRVILSTSTLERENKKQQYALDRLSLRTLESIEDCMKGRRDLLMFSTDEV